MNPLRVQILPSLLAADMGYLADAVRRVELAGADALHIDIMDAHFVPNLSMGPDVVRMAKRETRLHLSVHLMMTHPNDYIKAFIYAGASSLIIHIESSCDVTQTIGAIRAQGISGGVSLNPKTPIENAVHLLGKVDQVLFMTVQPGYGGQAFMPDVLPKILAWREEEKKRGLPPVDIMVDGGINHDTAVRCADVGANLFVAGTFLFKAADMKTEIATMRSRTTHALLSRK
jgi:ribulose-phosphate 3-epimerase